MRAIANVLGTLVLGWISNHLPFWGAVGLMGAWAVVLWVQLVLSDNFRRIIWRERRLPKVWVYGIAALIGAGIAVGLLFLSQYLHPEERTAEKPKVVEPPKVSLFVECNHALAPVKMPDSGRIWELRLWPIPLENGGGGLAQRMGQPGAELQFGDVHGTDRCDVINNAPSPIINVTMSLQLDFAESHKQVEKGGGVRQQSGAIVLSRPWLIDIPRIEPGAQHAFTFYIANGSADHFVTVRFPESARYHIPGETQDHTAIVQVPTFTAQHGIVFVPFTQPPPTQEEKRREGESAVQALIAAGERVRVKYTDAIHSRDTTKLDEAIHGIDEWRKEAGTRLSGKPFKAMVRSYVLTKGGDLISEPLRHLREIQANPDRFIE